MSRSEWLRKLSRVQDAAALCDATGCSEHEALDRLADRGRRRAVRGAFAAAGAVVLPIPVRQAFAQSVPDVAVVGAGFAGLYAATVLTSKGVTPEVYEAGASVGGRVASIRKFFPGQIAERGGELIDTAHTTLRGLANGFGLTLEDYNKQPGSPTYFLSGQFYSEAEVVAEYRAFVPFMNDDLQRLSNGPTADAFSAFDRQLDFTTLRDYLRVRGAGPLIGKLIELAYIGEYGREIDQQSCLSFLFFAKANRRNEFSPFGGSDERFHIVEGNDAVASGLAQRLSRQVLTGWRLLKVASLADGRFRLTLDANGKTVERTHGALVIAVPAPVVRDIDFSAVALPSQTRTVIAGADYGTNSKLMVGFRGRPWYERFNSNGSAYSDLANFQNTWETNASMAQFGLRGVLTNFTGGLLGARLDPNNVQSEAAAFLSALNMIWPGASTFASRDARGRVTAWLENWSRNPLFKGAYTNNQPGYFTTLEGLYAKPAAPNLVFAGEHTDSFYNFQGFMEGALLSGARAAEQIWRARR